MLSIARRLDAAAVLIAAWGWLALGAVPDGSAQTASSALDSLLAAPELRLDQLERAVLERNPTLAAARAAVREANARADRVGSLMNPMVEGMVAPRALGNEMIEAPGYVVGFSQNFPLFGERGLERMAARAEARAMGEDLRATRLDLLRETRRMYYELFLTERRLEINDELKDLLGQFRSVALRKYGAGVVGRQDALQAEVELSMLDHERIVLGRERRIVRARLNALLHRDPVEPLPAAVEPLPRARDEEELPVPADPALLRPDVQHAEAERDARAAELSLARRRRLPEFTLLARYDGMEDAHEMRPMVGAALSLPIWGRTGAAIREARAALERKEMERLAAIDRAGAEIEEARARLQETRHEIHIIETGVIPATERALTSIRAAYEADRSDFLALINAERDLARARLDLHRARAEYRMALADWERAIARDAGPPEEGTR